MVRVQKRKPTRPKRRVLKAKAKPKRKTARKSTPRQMTECQKQMNMYLEPFSRATKQPKIPDGKVGESLGFQTQAVSELIARDSDGEMTILLFPGISSGVIAYGQETTESASISSNRFKLMTYSGSNNVNYNFLTSNGGGLVSFQDDYSMWRVVSQGLRLSLLNPAETDDGWWESSRLHVGHKTTDFALAPGVNKSFGHLVPDGICLDGRSLNIVNETSYSTGTLRGLKDHVFKLHPVKDDHDFVHPRMTTLTDASDISNINSDNIVRFDSGSEAAMELINSAIDQSFDMILIKIHGRTDANNRTRLHANLVCNQEIVYQATETESRFHTSTEKDVNMEQASHGVRFEPSSAHMIP